MEKGGVTGRFKRKKGFDWDLISWTTHQNARSRRKRMELSGDSRWEEAMIRHACYPKGSPVPGPEKALRRTTKASAEWGRTRE